MLRGRAIVSDVRIVTFSASAKESWLPRERMRSESSCFAPLTMSRDIWHMIRNWLDHVLFSATRVLVASPLPARWRGAHEVGHAQGVRASASTFRVHPASVLHMALSAQFSMKHSAFRIVERGEQSPDVQGRALSRDPPNGSRCPWRWRCLLRRTRALPPCSGGASVRTMLSLPTRFQRIRRGGRNPAPKVTHADLPTRRLRPYSPGSVPLAIGTPTMLPHSVQEPS